MEVSHTSKSRIQRFNGSRMIIVLGSLENYRYKQSADANHIRPGHPQYFLQTVLIDSDHKGAA